MPRHISRHKDRSVDPTGILEARANEREPEIESHDPALVSLLMDAVNQGAPHTRSTRTSNGKPYEVESDLVWHAYISTWEDILPWLIEHGYAEGDPAHGVRLLWDKVGGERP